MRRPIDERITESLQELGLSLYEARLYLGLLTGGPQNGNELSRTSGVPSSKVYAMLERLAAEGIVAQHALEATPSNMSVVPPQDLLHKLRERYTKPLDFLDATLPTIGPDAEPEVLQVGGLTRSSTTPERSSAAPRARSTSRSGARTSAPLHADLAEADARGVTHRRDALRGGAHLTSAGGSTTATERRSRLGSAAGC